MAKITRRQVTEQFQHFLEELKESFWGDVYAKTRQAWKKFWEAQPAREPAISQTPVSRGRKS